MGRRGLASSLSAILWQRDPQIKGSAGAAARRRSAGAGGGGAVGRPGRREDSAGSAYVTGRAPARPPSGEVGAGLRRPQRRRGPPGPQAAEVRQPDLGRGQLNAGGGLGVPGPPGLALAPPSACWQRRHFRRLEAILPRFSGSRGRGGRSRGAGNTGRPSPRSARPVPSPPRRGGLPPTSLGRIVRTGGTDELRGGKPRPWSTFHIAQ